MIQSKKFQLKALTLLSVLFLAIGLSSCRKESFDEPPITGTDPDLKVNMTIDSLKKMYQDSILNKSGNITINNDWIIAATVVGDDQSGNLYKTMIIEDSTAGIAIRIDQSEFWRNYPVGRRVFIKLKGLVIGGYKGLIQIGGYVDYTSFPASAATIPANQIGKYIYPGVWGLKPKPSIVTIADLNNLIKWQNRLVQINDVQFQPSDTLQPFADAVNLLSKSRYLIGCNTTSPKLAAYTSGYCNFASQLTPTKDGSIVGIFSVYTSGQFLIRDLNDVSMMTNTYCGDGSGVLPGVISEDFSSITASSPIAISGWTNVAVVGTKQWLGKTFSTENFAEVTAYQSSLPSMESWLVTPGFNITAGDTLSFKSELAFYKHDGLTVWVSNNYSGNPATATWQQLTCALPGSATGNYNWVNSGDVSLNGLGLTGTLNVGFKYVGDGTTNTTTFRIDNVRVR